MAINHRHLAGIVIAWFVCISSQAQFQLPRFDVEIKGGIAIVGADQTIDQTYYVTTAKTFNYQVGAHWQLNQNIGIGWVYTKSLSGTIGFESGNGSSGPPPDNIFLMMNGPDLRISTGRTRKMRYYLSVNYVTLEFVEEKSGFRLAAKTNTFGGGIGMMLRLSNKVYWNIVELNAHPIPSDAVYWLTKTDVILEAKTGFTLNFGKRK
jgi:hypothetical protein